MATRAKFRCTKATVHENSQRSYEFTAVTDDGTPENERYHKYTPSGSLTLWVDNPCVSFSPGSFYTLDIERVSEGQ